MLYLRDIEVDVQIRCCACGHSGVLPRAMLERRFGPSYPVLSIAPHYRCSQCDSRDTEARPAPPDPVPEPANQSAAVPDEPSFDGPLAALRGLLDAARSRPDEDEEEDEAPPPPRASRPADERFAAEPQPRPVPPPAFSLADLVADPGPDPDGSPPLWEPVSLAEIAGRAERPVPPVALKDGGPPDEAPTEEEPEAWRWDDEPSAEEPAAPPPTPAIGRPREDDPDETLLAMRRFFADRDEDRREVEDPAKAEDEDEDDIVPPAFSARTLARTDFEDDAEDEEREEATDDEDPSEEDIVSFAIRDPERPPAPPARTVPPPTASLEPPTSNRMVRGSDGKDFEDHDASLEKTLAALRSMIEEAAAEPGPAADEDAPPAKPSAQRPAALAAWNDADDEGEEEEPPRPRPAPPPKLQHRDDDRDEDRDGDDWYGTGRPAAGRDTDTDQDMDRDEDPPRRSAQELEVEQAMLALRSLVEADEPAGQRRPQRPAPRPVDHLVDDEELLRLTGDARSPEPLTEPLDQVPTPPRRGGKPGEPSALEKTISALRGMLELDGKRKR